MGFDEMDFDRIWDFNPKYDGTKKLYSVEKQIKLAGNSICVDVLEAIFKQIFNDGPNNTNGEDVYPDELYANFQNQFR